MLYIILCSAINLYAKSSRSNSKLTAEMTKRRCTFYAVHILRYICARFAFYCIREEQIFSPPDIQSKWTWMTPVCQHCTAMESSAVDLDLCRKYSWAIVEVTSRVFLAATTQQKHNSGGARRRLNPFVFSCLDAPEHRRVSQLVALLL